MIIYLKWILLFVLFLNPVLFLAILITFQKPNTTKLEQFFEFHPQQPVFGHLFKSFIEHFMLKITFNVVGYPMILLGNRYIAVCV